MDPLTFSPAVFTVSLSNSAAFKQDQIFGPCLQYQLEHANQHRSSQQAQSLWNHYHCQDNSRQSLKNHSH